MKLLITGTSGFVGRKLAERALVIPHLVYALIRDGSALLHADVIALRIPALESEHLTTLDLAGIDVVVHCAARVHVMEDSAADPLVEYRKVNVDGTLALARQAVRHGVSRFVFISSIKVNGEETLPGAPFNHSSIPDPVDPYGISKWEAEQGLRQIAKESGMEVVIIRPVLVYGPGVRANFRSMMGWMNRSVPLPLGAIHNKRSMVALDNLVDLVMTCIDHPAAANQTFLVSDGEDLSTTELLKRTAGALGKPPRLLPVPAALLEFGAALLGKRAVAQRLCGSLQVDIDHTCRTLGWKPPVTVDEALRDTAGAFVAES